MTRTDLHTRLKNGVFFLDGAMGTQLIEAGAPAGCCNDLLNLDAPQIVEAVHAKYLAGGTDAVLTNTFGANRYVLSRHGLADKAQAINLAAARLGRKVAGEDRYVLGDIGPCGDFLEPLGTVQPAALLEAFAEQATALVEGGVDGFIIETMTALDEIETAVLAVQKVAPDLPVLVSLAYDPAGAEHRTMMGVSLQQAAQRLVPLGITALGYNCGTLDMDGYVALTAAYAEALAGSNVLLLAEPNAGRPQLEDGKAVYRLQPEAFAEAMVKIKSAGASILGGCCGTTPAHIAAAVSALR